MCGLTFIYSQDLQQSRFETLTRKALSRMVHRGPDDSGIAVGNHWAAGHRRLSIIDVRGSHQPMQDPAETHTLVFNGEIYNYKQLRISLRDAWPFKTDGDTEVILAGLSTGGTEFIRGMEGMWAFALWDEVNKRLILSRDRFGEKPLYYYSRDNFFACASELPALLDMLDSSPASDPASLADYLRYGFYAPGRTIYSDIREVLPGHTLSWKPGAAPQETPYWKLNFGTYAGTRQQAGEEIRSLMANAVESRMVADVEVGAFLSGGIDSSLIVSLLAGDLNKIPKTFCIGFEDKSFDEREYALLVADRYRTDHHTDIQAFVPGELNKLILDHVGQPFADASLLPTSLVSRLASGHVKVALSGDGGDELFSGYQRYHAKMFMRLASRMPEFVKNNLGKLLQYFPEPTSHHSRSYLKKAHLFINNYLGDRNPGPYFAPAIINEDELALLLPDYRRNSHLAVKDLPEYNDDIMNMMYHDLNVYLPQDILTKVDRATMSCSLESRAPFLDSRLVEFAMSLPRSWHRDIFSGKLLLKYSFRDYLPDKIWNRNKQGFAVPLHSWFKGTLGNELVSLLKENKNTVINTNLVNQWLNEHVSGIRDNSFKLWSVYVMFLWKTSRNIEF